MPSIHPFSSACTRQLTQSLDCGRKPEHPERTHADITKLAHRLHSNPGRSHCEVTVLTTTPLHCPGFQKNPLQPRTCGHHHMVFFSPLEMLGQAFTAPASSYCSVLSSCTKEHPLLVCDQVTDMTVEEYHISSPQKLGTVKRCPIGCAAFGSIWAGQCIPNFLRMHYIADLAPFFLCDTFILFVFCLMMTTLYLHQHLSAPYIESSSEHLPCASATLEINSESSTCLLYHRIKMEQGSSDLEKERL